MDHLLIHFSLFLLWSKLTIHDIQKQSRIFKQIRSINTELYYVKVIHQIYQIVAIIIVIILSVVIRITPNSIKSIFDRWMNHELQWNMWKIQSKENSLCSFQICSRTKKCSVCEIFIKWDDNPYRPCCSYNLRTRSFRGFGTSRERREKLIKRY